jgi:hypothetical protein
MPSSWYRNTFLSAVVVLACLALTSCGTTCVAGIFANGTGIILVKNSTPPPPALFDGHGYDERHAGKSRCRLHCLQPSAACYFRNPQSIQLHSVFPDSPNNPQWLELAPQLPREPRQIDLLFGSTPEIVVQSASVPAGMYRELLLQFLPDTPADPDALPAENSCGHNRRNCMLMADGRVEELHFTGNGDSSELLLPLQYNGSSSLAVVPGATVGLRFTLQPQQVSAVSPSEGWQIHYVLVGSASVSR